MTPDELISRLEDLSIADVDAAIDIKRDELSMLERLRAVIADEPIKMRKPRTPKLPADNPSQPVVPKPEIDKTVPLKTRVRAFLEVSGPSKFQQILRGAGCMPAQLTEVLNGAEFVFNEVEKTYTLTRHR